MKLSVVPTERFTCHSCTNCCRNWHVELLAREIEPIAQLRWPGPDPLAGAKVTIEHGGKIFLAHRADGACVFLNSSNGLCRIHEQFGEVVKPLGCRLYPFQIHPTFSGAGTVSARFDCPVVRQNDGSPHADALPALRRLADQLNREEDFSEQTRCGFDQDQIQAVCEFIATMMAGLTSDAERALLILHLCDALATTEAGSVDRSALAGSFGQLKQVISNSLAAPPGRPGTLVRIAFRMLLGHHLRRDDDVLDGRAIRIARAVAMVRIVCGGGNLQGLGVEHHAASIRRAKLFAAGPAAADATTFSLFWRMICVKLDTLHFMGSANGGRNFLEGLRSLALLYPLTRAVAKYNAANRQADAINVQDVDNAVAAIEHSFGRSAVLNQPHARSLERLLLQRDNFTRILRTL